MVRESPEFIAQEIDAVRARTARPFAVNLIPAATTLALFDAELGCVWIAPCPRCAFSGMWCLLRWRGPRRRAVLCCIR